MSAQPIVSFLDGSALTAPIGGTRTVTLRFGNQPDAAAGSNVGYSPYISLVIPSNGADGAGTGSSGATANDGITFLGATYLGASVQTFPPVEFDATGKATHPFATDAAGNPLIVTGTPGDTLVVLRLPFGSFTPGQTPADIQVQLQVSNLADLGTPLSLRASGGFAYGRDPLLNPAADAPVTGPAASLAVTPTVISLDNVYVGPEQETATGPSYPRSWLVKADIAAGQTVTKLVLTDRMPDGTVITGASIQNGTGTVTYDNATGLVVATFTGSYTGGGAAPTLKIDFYVPEYLRDGTTPVLDPETGAFRELANNARLDATWQPTDGRDPLQIFAIDEAGPEDVVTAKSIAVQKSVAVVDTLKAGGTLEWTLDGQVSNYFDMDELVLTDTLGDGQVYKPGQAVKLVVREGGATIFDGALSPENISVTRDPATGKSTIKFDVSAQLAKAGVDDVLNGSPGGTPHQATVQVKFQSLIEKEYDATSPAPSNEPLVDQGDPLANGILFGGEVEETGSPRADDSGAGVTLPVSDVSKSIYAINGKTGFASTLVSAGDTITFRLKLDMPLTGAHDVALTDFLPLPVLDLSGAVKFQNVTGSAAPASGFAKWGPGATFVTSGDISVVPTVTFDDASNSLRFDFGDAVAPGNPRSTIDLLFTVTVLDREFGDGLLLTNQVTSSETNSFGTVSEDNAIVQFTLGEPELRISKGVVAHSNATGLSKLVDLGASIFSPWGSDGTRFNGTISSQGLAARPVDADLTDADAGDRVTFAIIVENTGSSPKGAFDVLIRDTLPPGFKVPLDGLNLRVTDGTGAAKSFRLEGGGFFDPEGGLRLTDSTTGAIGTYDAASGKNILVITYDLELAQDAPAFGAELVNTASIAHFAAQEGGTDRTPHVAEEDVADTATVTTASPVVTKTVASTSESHTGSLAGNDMVTDLTIGETVTYRITVTLPEGSLKSFRIDDYLPVASEGGVMTVTGARLVSVTGLGLGSVFDTTPTITYSDRDGKDGNDTATFDFGDVLNKPGIIENAPATVTVEVTARLRDNAANARGDVLTNTAVASAADPDTSGSRVTSTGKADIEVVAPNIDVTKTASTASADASDTVKYTITVENKGLPASGAGTGDFTARAWDVNLKDVLTDVLKDASLQSGTVTISGVPASRITRDANDPLNYTLDYLDPGEKITVKFDVVLNSGVDAGERLDNTATALGSSMDGTSAADDRVSQDTATATVTVAAPSVTKVIVATSDANTYGPESSGTTPANQYGSNVDLAIGEVVTYEIRVRLPEGDSPSLRITDLMEDLNTSGNGSLTYVPGSVQVVSVGSKLTGSTLLSSPTVTVDNGGGLTNDDRIVLNFGDVTNTTVNSEKAYSAADNEEFVVIRLKAVVNDLSQNNGADALDNSATAATGRTGTPSSTSSSSTVRVDVVEPSLTIDKSSSVAAGQPLDAGAEVQYTLVIRHGSTSRAPAYDLTLSDLVPAGMELKAGSLTASAGTVAANGNAISWSLGQYLLGTSEVTIRYTAKLLDSVTPGQILSNTARLTYDTNPADPADPASPTAAEDLASRTYNAQDTETRTVVLAPTIDKTVIATGDANTGSSVGSAADPDAAPGETVTYRLTVTAGEGTQRLVVSDSLPGGILFESAKVTKIGADITGSSLALNSGPSSVSGGVYSFDFGTITNRGDNDTDAGDTIEIEVQGRVAPNAAAGTTLTNTAKAESYAPGAGKVGLGTATDSAKVDVARPDLVIDKVANRPTVDGGDIVTYTVTLKHDAGSTAPAYLLSLSDLLPPGVTLVAGSATASAGTVTETDGRVGWSLNQLLLGAAPVIITYQARVANNVVDGQAIANTAQVTYSSAPALGATVTESDQAAVGVDIVNSVVKTLESTSLSSTTGASVGIGEEVSFLVTANVGEGAQRLVLRDVLPTGLDYVSSSLVSLGGLTGSPLTAGATGSYDAATRTVSFNLGDVLNPADNLSTPGDQVVFRVVAKVADSAANSSGKLLTNLGQLVSSAPANPYGVTPGSGSQTVGENEAITVVRASLGGIAFRDTDGDGLRDAGEATVLPGITVALLNADGSATGRTAVTDANGAYLFDGLVPGSYRVRFEETAPERRSLANQGTDDTKDSDADQATGVTDQIYTLVNGMNLRGVDAGFYRLASIGDRVWEDLNGDGLQNNGEAGIAGVTVRLLDAGKEVVGTVTTGADGSYSFGGLVPGEYEIKITAPGYFATRQNVGNAEAADSDIAENLRSDDFTLVSGQAETRLDAGLYRGATLGGTVFEDGNGNGLQDAGERGITGRTVTLLDAAGNSTGETRVTDADGSYAFTGLAPGSYAVLFAQEGPWPFTPQNAGADDALDSDADPITGRTASVTLLSGGSDMSLDAGIVPPPASIGDRVWEDLDRDGVQDANEAGLAGVTVRLLDATGSRIVAMTVSGADGSYGFDGLAPGSYRVEFVAPPGYVLTRADAGSSDAADSDADPSTGRTAIYVLSGDEDDISADAGFVPTAAEAERLPPTVLTPGNDAFPGTEAPDHVRGGDGDDNLHGLRGGDALKGEGGNDVINGHEGNDLLTGGAGNDNLHGNDGHDTIIGNSGDDTVESGEGDDWAETNTGDDAMQGEGGNDTLLGGAGDDIVEGNAGNDAVLGGSGDDRVAGHDGDDMVVGGVDSGSASLLDGRVTGLVLGDTLSGDGGADRFVWQRGDGVDLILDFKPSEGDRLDIYGYDGILATDRVDGRTVLYLGANSAIVMNDHYPQDGTLPGIFFHPDLAEASGLPVEKAPAFGLVGGDAATGSADANTVIELGNGSGLPENLTVVGASVTSGGGSVDIGDDGRSITYSPGNAYNYLAVGASERVVVTYTVSDGKGGTDVSELVITITGTNEAPVMDPDALSRDLGACAAGMVISAADLGVGDADDPSLTYTVTALGTGRLMIGGELVTGTGATFTQADIEAGRVAYIAGPVQTLTDGIGLAVSDGNGGTTATTLIVSYTSYGTPQTAPQWGGYWGGDGNDYLLGTAEADNMSGGNGCDQMAGGAGDDQLHGQEGNNRIFGQTGNDNLTGGSGNDLLDGGEGDDQIHAQGGQNWLFGGAGQDMLTSGDGDDRMYGGEGNDSIHAGGGHNRIDAGSGADEVTTGAGNDVIIGGAGNDRIHDGGGSNMFKLGGVQGAVSDGDDEIWTGAGADKFALHLTDHDGNAAGWGHDTVNGFRIGQGDQLVAFDAVEGLWDDADAIGALIDAGLVSGARSADGGDLLLTFGQGAAASSLTLKWFFWDNAWYLSGTEKATPKGEAIGRENLTAILLDAIEDGSGHVAGTGAWHARAHDYISAEFML